MLASIPLNPLFYWANCFWHWREAHYRQSQNMHRHKHLLCLLHTCAKCNKKPLCSCGSLMMHTCGSLIWPNLSAVLHQGGYYCCRYTTHKSDVEAPSSCWHTLCKLHFIEQRLSPSGGNMKGMSSDYTHFFWLDFRPKETSSELLTCTHSAVQVAVVLVKGPCESK